MKPINPLLAQFTKGQRVRFAGTCRRTEMIGLAGTVKQVVKSRGVVTVELDDNEVTPCAWYDAYPESLEACA